MSALGCILPHGPLSAAPSCLLLPCLLLPLAGSLGSQRQGGGEGGGGHVIASPRVLRWHAVGAGRARLEIQRLTADNLSLYEKIRFLEHYNQESQGGGRGPRRLGQALLPAGAGAGAALPPLDEASGGPGNGSLTETRYRTLYEEKMNPFAEFHHKEQERSYRNLRLHDKVSRSPHPIPLS